MQEQFGWVSDIARNLGGDFVLKYLGSFFERIVGWGFGPGFLGVFSS